MILLKLRGITAARIVNGVIRSRDDDLLSVLKVVQSNWREFAQPGPWMPDQDLTLAEHLREQFGFELDLSRHPGTPEREGRETD